MASFLTDQFISKRDEHPDERAATSLSLGSRGMNGFQFGIDEDVDVTGGHAILKMKGQSLADVLVEIVDGFALREDIFADSRGAPKVTVVIDFHFYQYSLIL